MGQFRRGNSFCSRNERTARRLQRWGFRAAAVIAATVLLATACANGRTANASTRPGAVVTGATTAPPFQMLVSTGYGSTWSFNAFNSYYFSWANYTALLPLALPTSLTKYVPYLAQHWSVQGNTLTVVLRNDAKWQDGRSVTSTDVVDTALLDGIASTGLWTYLDGVSAHGARKVSFTLAPEVPHNLALQTVLDMIVLPAQTYAPFLPHGIAASLSAYYRATNSVDHYNLSHTTQKTAPTPPAWMTKADKRLVDFNPPKLVADGPFTLQEVTTLEAKFEKNPRFYGANRLHIQTLIWNNAAETSSEGSILTGGSDFTWDGLTWPFYQKERAHGLKIFRSPTALAYGFALNEHRYPLNELKVRQALAYIIERPHMLAVQDGGGTYQYYSGLDVPLPSTVEHQYLTAKQLHSLTNYSYNPAKATSLLKSAGFRKVNGHWLLPNGKPFKLTLEAPSGWNDTILMTLGVTRWLNQFGIRATSSSVEQPGYWTYMDDGQFDVDWEFTASGSGDPMQDLGTMVTSVNRISPSEPGISVPVKAHVPGLGYVNVRNTMAEDEATVTTPAQLRTSIWDWARYLNKDLPFLTYGEKVYPFQVYEGHYSDYPPANSAIWKNMAYDNNIVANIIRMMELGYVRPTGH